MRSGLRMIARGLVLLFACFALNLFVWQPWSANRVLARVIARSRTAMTRDRVTAAILARQNIDALREVEFVKRDDPNYYMLYAANAMFLDDPDLAVRMYSAALDRVDHRPELYYERGEAYLRMGNIDAAVADIAHAARFDPTILDALTGELRNRVVQTLETER